MNVSAVLHHVYMSCVLICPVSLCYRVSWCEAYLEYQQNIHRNVSILFISVSHSPKNMICLGVFVKLKSFKKTEKNSEVGQVGSGQAPTRINFFLEIVCFFVFLGCFHVSKCKKKKKLIMGWVGAVRLIRVFLGFLEFF